MANHDLDGRVVLVTGGGTGIGRACCLMFAEAGAAVAVNYSKSESEAREVAEMIAGSGGRSISCKADVSREDEVIGMFDAVLAGLGPVDILVNNAGTTTFVPFGDLDGITDEIWDRIFAINVKGMFYCARQAARHMRSAERGSRGGAVVNVASISGVTGYGSSIPYATSKAAVISLTRSLALALAPDIRVNCATPGVVETRWVDGHEDFVRSSAAETPLARNAAPEDVAEVVFALAVSAGFVTGQSVTVDGGRRM